MRKPSDLELNQDLRDRLEELGASDLATMYLRAMEQLIRLDEIVEESESDHHWTNRVEWLVDDSDDLIRELKGYLSQED